jgi:hypothetical protein
MEGSLKNRNPRRVKGCLLATAALLLLSVAWTAGFGKGGMNMTEKAISQVLREHTDELMSLPGVVGTGEGLCDGRPCIKVYVIKKTPELEQEIHRLLDPYPLSIEETGRFRSLPGRNDDEQ